jgi:hypothetical protein
MTASQRAKRVLKDCTFFGRLQGAIHAIDIIGTLTY